MKHTSKFRMSMISDANKAAAAMPTSSIAAPLQQNGFTAAAMAQAASDLTALHSKASAAHGAWLQASAALAAKAETFDQTWSSYSNIVRGLTTDETTRKTLGVASPGIRKTPAVKRGPRKAKVTTATAPAAPTSPAPATPTKS
jgi:hypothetical protein